MIAGIIILAVMILMVVFLARRVKSAQRMFDDIQTGDPEERQEQKEGEDVSGKQ